MLLAAWGPCGFAPVAPGTVGTLGAIPLWLALTRLDAGTYLAFLLAFTALAMVAAQRAGRFWGIADASPIVLDEVVGYLMTMAFVPWSWQAAAIGFVLFRIFDVVKPWPANAFDRVKNGFGVVMDDAAAGVWSWIVLQCIMLALRHSEGCTTAHWWCLLGTKS